MLTAGAAIRQAVAHNFQPFPLLFNINPADMGSGRHIIQLDRISFGTTDDLFLRGHIKAIPGWQVVDKTLHHHITAPGKFTIRYDGDFMALLLLRVFCAVDKAGHVTGIKVAEPIGFIDNLNILCHLLQIFTHHIEQQIMTQAVTVNQHINIGCWCLSCAFSQRRKIN